MLGMRSAGYTIFLFVGLIFLAMAAGPARAEDRPFSIHVGSFQEEKDARREVAGYKAQGLLSFYRYETIKGKGMWHRVYVGRFQSEPAAEQNARDLKSRGAIDYYLVRRMELPGQEDVRLSRAAATEGAASGDTSQYRQIVYGRYVASYRNKLQADLEAEGLTQYGWPAMVVETWNNGQLWYQVYLVPPAEWAQGPISGFVLLMDLADTVNPGPLCAGLTPYTARQAMWRYMMNAPGPVVQAALRKVSFALDLAPQDNTDRVWGVKAYEAESFQTAAASLPPSASASRLGYGIAASDRELSVMSGKKALIIVSNFKKSSGFGDPLAQAAALKRKYGKDLCIYTIYIGADDEGIRLARDIAVVGQCGNWLDGCLLLANRDCLLSEARAIFRGRSGGGSACLDSDRDGVFDNRDECPNTPLGAVVDERGCWTIAWAQYFDFDRDMVKKQYIHHIANAARILKRNPRLMVEVAGHCDIRGSREYNIDLGRRRAKAVRDVLIQYGIAPERLTVKSYGKDHPVNHDGTEAGHAKNRRVELHVWQPNARRFIDYPKSGQTRQGRGY